MLLVISSHLQLQKEGFLSTWTNSFVGPWDPSQGLHNPGRDCWLSGFCNHVLFVVVLLERTGGTICLFSSYLNLRLDTIYTKHADEKIKLWLFLPGRHSSVVETAQSAVSRLRGIICYWILLWLCVPLRYNGIGVVPP